MKADPNNNYDATRKRKCEKTFRTVGLCLAALLGGVDVPDNVVGKANDFVACPLRHFSETFRLGLVLECVAGKVDT